MIKFTYFLLKIIELTIFLIYGKKISKTQSRLKYWKLAIVPILTFSIVEGLRFGRFIDWNLYYFRYQQLGTNVSYLEYEILFRYICNTFYQLGIPYYGFIFLQCLFFIFSVFVLLERFKKECKWCIPLILVCSTANEMFIRWFLAFSFILLSINSFLSKKYRTSIIWLLCSFFCHSGIIVIAIITACLGCLKRHVIPGKIAVILLFLTTFVLSLADVIFVAHIASFLSPIIGESFTLGSYLEHTVSILDGTWGGVGIMERSIIKNIGSFIAYAPVILWGQKYMSEYKYGIVFYNLFVIGAIGSPLFTVEIFNRIFSSCLFFFCIVGGIYYSKIFNATNKAKKIVFIISIASLLFAIAPHISDAVRRDSNAALFIWDSNGRHYLPF